MGEFWCFFILTSYGGNFLNWVFLKRVSLYLGTSLTDHNSIHEKIKSRLKSGNACYHLVQNLLSSTLLSKSMKIEIIHNCCFVWYGCETGSLTLKEEHRLRVLYWSYRVHTYSTWCVSITNSYTQFNNNWHSSLYLSQHVSTDHSIILRGYLLQKHKNTFKNFKSLKNTQHSSSVVHKHYFHITCTYGQLNNCVVFLRLLKFLKVFLCFWNKHPLMMILWCVETYQDKKRLECQLLLNCAYDLVIHTCEVE
jgi:predicted transcriptional regulator with HTH domain